MIPQEKTDAVARALNQAFGVTTFDDIQFLTKGLSSALIFRIVVQGRSYLLRVITRTDAMADPTRHFHCMQHGAAAGLAPRVWYTSIEDRITITDYVDAVPFPASDARVLMPGHLRTLHALPPFPAAVNWFEAVDGFVRKFQDARIVPEEQMKEFLKAYTQVTAVYPRDRADHVACHNDLKPENVLFDGRRPWLVDWEAAFLNDRYLDLGIFANFVVTDETEERAFLQEYFERAPKEYELARFFLMRQILHASYATLFMWIGAAGQPISRADEAPNFRDFNDRMWRGDIDLNDNATKVAYGRAHLHQFADNVRNPRYKQALRILADRHAKSPLPLGAVLLI